MQAITLTENLHHPGYSWPESLVFLPGKAPAEQPFHLVDAQGCVYAAQGTADGKIALCTALLCGEEKRLDRKSTRLNSSHSGESRMPSSA